jgi:hypothetical protein
MFRFWKSNTKRAKDISRILYDASTLEAWIFTYILIERKATIESPRKTEFAETNAKCCSESGRENHQRVPWEFQSLM